MSTQVIRNSRAAEPAPVSPVHEDGTRYPYAMHFDGDKFIGYADTPTELLGILIEGYEELESQDAQVARIRLAISAQVAAQAQINADAMATGAWESLSESEQALLNGPRFEQPHGWGDPNEMGDVWDSKIPLVLVETGYAPYGEVDKPISGIADVLNPPNIFWLRPVDEWEFLQSLHHTGFISVFEATDI